MKYLGTVIYSKFKFSEHISYAAQRCKLIHSLSKLAKISWGLQHEALQTIYEGTVLYGAPVWIEAMQYEQNRQRYVRVQRLTSIRMAKAYRRTSSQALCFLTGMTATIIKTGEAVRQYNIRKGKGNQTQLFDSEVELKNWPHPSEVVKITETKKCDEQMIRHTQMGAKMNKVLGPQL